MDADVIVLAALNAIRCMFIQNMNSRKAAD